MKFYFVFLVEIKLSWFEMDTVKKKLGNFDGRFVDGRGRVGGLVMLWEKGSDVLFLFDLLNYIDVKIGWVFFN